MGFSIYQLLIVLGIVILLFGTKRLRNIGSDLGGAIKGFKKSMSDEGESASEDAQKNIENQASANNVQESVQAAPDQSGASTGSSSNESK